MIMLMIPERRVSNMVSAVLTSASHEYSDDLWGQNGLKNGEKKKKMHAEEFTNVFYRFMLKENVLTTMQILLNMYIYGFLLEIFRNKKYFVR